MARILFVSGIDTDIGKTVAAAWLGEKLLAEGRNAGLLKLIQTGVGDRRYTEDEEVYARAVGKERARTGIRLQYPSSPALAAKLEGRELSLAEILAPVREMASKFDPLVIEGAGGLLVPVLPGMTMADIAAREGWELVLVTCPRLGALNHTLLSLEAAKNRNLAVNEVVVNLHGAGPKELQEEMFATLEAQGLKTAILADARQS